jgi:hypothetical protein
MSLQRSYPVARQDFDDDGYLLLSDFLDGSAIAELLANLNRFFREVLRNC